MKRFLLFFAAFSFSFFSLNAQVSADTCAGADGATAITGPGTFSVSAVDGAGTVPEKCDPSGPDNPSAAEWYRYVPTSSSFVTITTDLAQNSGDDTAVSIYTGSCGSLTCLAGNDDIDNSNWLSEVGFSATAGTTYYIAWDNRWSASGFDFELSEGTPPPPSTVSFTTTSVSASGTDLAIVDMNNDFLDDLVSVSQTNININYQLAGGGFNSVNITTSSADNTPSWSLAAGDFDGNGYNDLLYGGGTGVTFMKANSTGTAYTEISGPEYVFSQRSNFVDIDNDGHLDAFVCHDVDPNVYYLNDGSGNLTFYQGADPAGVPSGLGINVDGGNYGTVWIDYDNDRDIDMFIAKCRGASGIVPHQINELWRNNGDGTFTEVAGDPGVNMDDSVQTWSSAWADFDNDGDMDAYIGASNFTDGGYHKLMINNGNGTFTESTDPNLGISGAPTGIENAPGDFNNDGFVDILTNSQILFNDGDMTFTLESSGMPPSGPIGDVNNDGFLDVFNGTVRMNDGNSNNWLKINTIGVQSNLNGIGARVEITSAGLGTQIRDVRSGEGFRYMSSLTTHFGLGADTAVSNITIYWPSGTIDVLINEPANQTITVTEGETLSLQQSMTNDLILYPNPTTDVLNLNASYGFENAIYSVFDMNGKRVLNSRFDSNTIDVSRLSAGNYILRIIDNGLMKAQKFIKR